MNITALVFMSGKAIILRKMNLIDKFTDLHFAICQLVPIVRMSRDHIAAHGDLDNTVVFGSNCIYLFPICREQDIEYKLLVLLHSDTL